MKNDATRQLTFELPSRPALGREDFFQAPSNALALAMLDGDWQGQTRMVLTGPAGSGKTHLAHVWAQETGAQVLPALDLAATLRAVLDNPLLPLVVEDIDDLAGDRDREEPLFHLLNARAQSGAGPLLLTHQGAVADGGFALPDLQSRLLSLPLAALEAPDDQLLAVVLVKLFADRQIEVPGEVITYLCRHMERSFADAGAIVAQLDKAALAAKRPITRPLAASVLHALYGHNDL